MNLSIARRFSDPLSPIGRLIPVAALLLSAGCDILLGPDPEEARQFTAQWESEIITTGRISGLDLAISDNGDLLTSYVYEESSIRVSRLTGSGWEHLEGPAVSGSGTMARTHIASGPGGDAALLYYSGSDMEIIPVNADLGTPIPLGTLETTRRDTLYPRPEGWHYDSADITFGSDGQIRTVVNDATDGRLWLFRQEVSGWSLGIVPNSGSALGKVEIGMTQNGHEHVVFQANSQGFYYWWRPGHGWWERLRIPDSQPYFLRFRSDETSVLATRQLNRIRVAEEVYDSVLDASFWLIRTAVENELLFWHNMDLALDENGYPCLVYILYQDWDDQFQVWITSLEPDGTWSNSVVASNLRVPYFSPFDTRLERDASGRLHIILTTGAVTGVSGTSQEHSYQLVHLYSDNPHGPDQQSP
jgi:hypothetical protein